MINKISESNLFPRLETVLCNSCARSSPSPLRGTPPVLRGRVRVVAKRAAPPPRTGEVSRRDGGGDLSHLAKSFQRTGIRDGLDFSVGGVRVAFDDAWGDRFRPVGGASAGVKVMQAKTRGPTLPHIRSVLSCLFYDIKNIGARGWVLRGRRRTPFLPL